VELWTLVVLLLVLLQVAALVALLAVVLLALDRGPLVHRGQQWERPPGEVHQRGHRAVPLPPLGSAVD
jgi:hypothetical protein